MGGGSDGATGIGNCWPQLQTSHCETERQVRICVLIVFSWLSSLTITLPPLSVVNLIIALWFEMLGWTREKQWRLGECGGTKASQKATTG
jgi:hypothetical protein